MSGIYSIVINSIKAGTKESRGMLIINSSPEITKTSLSSLKAAICAEGSSICFKPRKISFNLLEL